MSVSEQHYSLPLSQIPDGISQIAEVQWMSALCHLNAVDINRLLVERWKNLTNSSYKDLARLIQDGEPRGFVVANGMSWLVVSISKYIATERGVQTFSLYLRRPFSNEEAAHCLKGFNLNSNTRSDMIDLIAHFGGLRDQEPGHSGSFLEPPDVDSVSVWYDNPHIGEAAAYPILYVAANGDLLGVSPEGQTDWYCIEDVRLESPARHFGRSISDTVSKWANCNDWIDGSIFFDGD